MADMKTPPPTWLQYLALIAPGSLFVLAMMTQSSTNTEARINQLNADNRFAAFTLVVEKQAKQTEERFDRIFNQSAEFRITQTRADERLANLTALSSETSGNLNKLVTQLFERGQAIDKDRQTLQQQQRR